MIYDESSINANKLGPESKKIFASLISDLVDDCDKAISEIAEMTQFEQQIKPDEKSVSSTKDHYDQFFDQAQRIAGRIRTAQKILQGTDTDIRNDQPAVADAEFARIILEACEAERRKIARDIHDGPAQSIAAALININLLSVQSAAAADHEQLKLQLSKLQDSLKDSINELRQILFELKPLRMEETSLQSILEEYLAAFNSKYSFAAELQVSGSRRTYPIHIQTALLRLVQEAVTNIRKHAGVTKAQIALTENEDMISLLIKDEGSGFNKDKEFNKASSYGFSGMLERVDLLGGSMDISTEPGTGTQITIKIPLKGRHYIGESKSIDRR